MNNTLVSVIVPNYCHAKYLDQRIQSILNQTYQNFELIILDDCSPDNGASKGVIEKYRNNPHVSHIIYNETNSGSTFKQWDKGINLAKGELIWIAESDDFCEPTLLEKLVSAINNNSDASFAYVLSMSVDSNGKPLSHTKKTMPNQIIKGHDYICRYMCCGNSVENASSAVFDKNRAINISPIYKEYKGTGDRLFWIELAEKGSVCIVNEPLNYFRKHENKVTPRRSYDGTSLKEAYKTYLYMCQHCKLSWFRRNIIKGYYQSMVLNTELESEELRRELCSLWRTSKTSLLFRFLGRTMMSLRFRYNIYL